MKYEKDTIQYEEECPKMVKIEESLSKYQLKVDLLKRENRDLK